MTANGLLGPLAVDGAGDLFVAVIGAWDGRVFSSGVRKVSSDGTISTVAGNGNRAFSGDNGPATAASFNYIIGMSADAGGNMGFTIYDKNRKLRAELSSGTDGSATLAVRDAGGEVVWKAP